MSGTKKGIVLALCYVALAPVLAGAEPSYLIYPSSPAVFRFDPGRYEVVTPPDPRFDPAYAIGGKMLWDTLDDRVPIEIYRAPNLIGLEPSSSGLNEFATLRNDFEIIVDGFGPVSRTLANLCLRFWFEPATGWVDMTVNGRLQRESTMELPTLEVVTPVAPGYFADTSSVLFDWIGASVMRVIAFSDKDGDRAFSGQPQFAIVALNSVVPVAPTTWGKIKSLYR